MAGFYRDLIAFLKEAGCYFVREGVGDHEIWFSPKSKAYFTVDKGSKSRHTANEALKQAGLKKKF